MAQLNSNDDWGVPSVEVRLYLFTVKYHGHGEKYWQDAMEKDFAWLVQHSGVRNKITAIF